MVKLLPFIVLAILLFCGYASVRAHRYYLSRMHERFVTWIMIMFVCTAVLAGIILIGMLILTEGII